MKTTIDVRGFLTISRIPNLVIIGLTQFITAFFLLDKPISSLANLNFFVFILSTGMIGAAGYIINDYFDQKMDMINRPKEVVVGITLKRRLALLSHIILTLVGIFLGFIIDSTVGVIHIFSAGALWTYSISLRRSLLLGTLTVSFLTCLTLLLVMVYFREFNLLVVTYAMFGCAIIFIRESLKDIVSAKGEVQFGIQSVPIVWGIRGAKTLIYLVEIIAVIALSFYLFHIPNWAIRYFFIAVVLFIFWITYSLVKADKMEDFKKIKLYVDITIFAGLISMFLI